MKRGGPLRRTPLAARGARAEREAEAEDDFREEIRERCKVAGGPVPVYRCERCHRLVVLDSFTAHHLTPRGRAPRALKHDPKANGAGLCSLCHGAVHDHTVEDWGRWIR